MASPRPHSYNNQGYLPNGASGITNAAPPVTTATPLLPNNGRVVQAGRVRVLCVADVRGNLRSINDLAKQARADYVIHTGDFGFYDDSSLDRIADKTLKHVAQYSPLLSGQIKAAIMSSTPGQPPVKQRIPPDQLTLSELPQFLNKSYTLDVPVYTVWGACEDVRVLEKFRSKEYNVPNLHIIDEANSRLLDVGGVKLRLLGLGGAVVMHKLFDNGEGKTTIAGGQGTMWTTLLQMGELVDTANRVYDPTETRVFVTHASPAREGLLNQLSVTLKSDFSISAGLHFRYGSSYNEFSVNPTLDHYRGKLAASKASFNDVWETVRSEVEPAVAGNDPQNNLLHNALEIVSKMPSTANGGNPFGGPVGGPNAGATGQVDESAFKNMWNFNLADAAFGWLVLDVDNGRIGTEMKAQGFNFAHRGGKQVAAQQAAATNTTPSAPVNSQTITATTPTGPANTRSPAPATSNHNNQQPPLAPARNIQPQSKASSGPTRVENSATPATSSQTVKPVTPVPSSASVSLPATEKTISKLQTTDSRNGAASTERNEKFNVTPAPKPNSPIERKLSTGLYVAFVADEQACRDLFSEEDSAKIVRIERLPHGRAYAVHFSTHEEMKAILDRQPKERLQRTENGQSRKIPYVKTYDESLPRGSARWGPQGGNRGGNNNNQGYRSGGASDSEGGRGRGGFRGMRGNRGGERGERGARGSGRGRGNFNNNKSEQAGESQPSPGPEAPKIQW
ncbi:MAG: hypothetical protein M1829_006035 [Trizodia sp. TS-e1964]|nr:MAG: hypothetical protein M1829_006035 [Trizodia sp. TS-e1964]